MKIDKFLKKCIEEPSFVTVEYSSAEPLSEEQIAFYNKTLQRHGYFVDCYKCDTCEEHSNNKEPYHIERRDIYLIGTPGILCSAPWRTA